MSHSPRDGFGGIPPRRRSPKRRHVRPESGRLDPAATEAFADTDAVLFRVQVAVDDGMPSSELAQQMLAPLARIFRARHASPSDSGSGNGVSEIGNLLENTVRNILAALIVRATSPTDAEQIPPTALHALAQDELFLRPYAAVTRWLAHDARLPDDFPVPQESLEAYLRQRFDDETWTVFLENPPLDAWQMDISVHGDQINAAVWVSDDTAPPDQEDVPWH